MYFRVSFVNKVSLSPCWPVFFLSWCSNLTGLYSTSSCSSVTSVCCSNDLQVWDVLIHWRRVQLMGRDDNIRLNEPHSCNLHTVRIIKIFLILMLQTKFCAGLKHYWFLLSKFFFTFKFPLWFHVNNKMCPSTFISQIIITVF